MAGSMAPAGSFLAAAVSVAPVATVAAVIVLAGPTAAAAQEPAAPDTVVADTVAPAGSGTAADPAGDDTPRPVTPADYGRWEELGHSVLSPDGEWMAVSIRRVNDENELRIHRVGSDSVVVIGYGSSAAFSGDGRWAAFSIGVSDAEREAAQGRGEHPERSLGILDLASGDTAVVAGVTSFAFSDDGRFLAMRRYPAGGATGDDEHGADLVVRNLAAGTDVNFGNVGEFAWQDHGPLLAMTVDAADNAGNGVRVWDADRGTLRSLDAHPSEYRELRWREGAADLVVLRARQLEGRDDPTHVVLAWKGVDGPARRYAFDPAERPDFPTDARVVEHRTPAFSEDGSALFFGVQDAGDAGEAAPGAGESDRAGDGGVADSADSAGGAEVGQEPDSAAVGEPQGDAQADDEASPDVEVWHSRDVDLIPWQKQWATRQRRRNDLSVWHLDADRFVRLGEGLSDAARRVAGDRVAVATDETPYRRLRMFGPRYVDVYVIDMTTGERRKVIERVEHFFGASPGGRYLLYLEDDDYRVYDLRADRHIDLTTHLPTVFVDTADDHTVEQAPPFGVVGWTAGDGSVLLLDEYDVWRVRPDGTGRRITDGRADSVVHRYTRVGWADGQEAIDPEAPVYFFIRGQWSKKRGYAVAPGLGDPPERRVWLDARVGWLSRAEDADVFAYRVESFDDSPDYFVSRGGLREGEQLTRINPFHDDFAWGRSELIEYENAWGRRLQGALFYPADWDPDETYPMITWVYETRSFLVHQYYVPSEEEELNPAVWTANGYFVFQPDIVYRGRDPGLSAVETLVPAVERVVATGMVDPERVGLVGHSWGGYQAAFVPTRTDVFAAAVAGAPLTDLVSKYLSVYWAMGLPDAYVFETYQGRMDVPPWEDWESYRRNSPVHNIESLDTPMLVFFGTEDRYVDWNQGLYLYNAARRADKELVLLVYEGEGHGLSEDANEVDLHRRINQWFDHYLKGEPAPAWITEGVPYVEQEDGAARPGQ